jgi:hypothetical protein
MRVRHPPVQWLRPELEVDLTLCSKHTKTYLPDLRSICYCC